MSRLGDSQGYPATITVLSVSPHDEDHGALDDIFRNTDGNWKLYRSYGLQWATVMLRLHEISIIVCERDLRDGDWMELFERTVFMPRPPLMIVTSRLADERMWAEVLNLGGWDVLAKPFDRTEVTRVVESAWQHWEDRHHSPAIAVALRGAGMNM